MSERARAKELLAKLGMSERRKQIYGEGIDRATDAELALASDGLEDALNNVDAGLAAADHILARRRARLAPELSAENPGILTAIEAADSATAHDDTGVRASQEDVHPGKDVHGVVTNPPTPAAAVHSYRAEAAQQSTRRSPSNTRHYQYFTLPITSVPDSPSYTVWFATWNAARSTYVWSRNRPTAPTTTWVCGATDSSPPADATILIDSITKRIDPPPLAVPSNVSETEFREALKMQLIGSLDKKKLL